MVILIITFPLPSQNARKSKTIRHHGTHLTLYHLRSSANQPPVSHIILRTKFRPFNRNARPNAAVTDNIQPWLLARSATIFLSFIFFFVEVNSHRDSVSCELYGEVPLSRFLTHSEFSLPLGSGDGYFPIGGSRFG